MAGTFAGFVAWPAKTLVVLMEMTPAYRLTGWTKTAGRNFVYQIALSPFESGGGRTPVYRQLLSVWENATALTVQTSIATVDATIRSYFWDSANGLLYVRTGNSGSPETFTSYRALVRFRFASTGIVVNLTDGDPTTGVYYHPWLSGGYDTIVQQMEDALTGITINETVQLELTNGHGFWHPVVATDGKYAWKNKTVSILIGGSYNGQDLPYSQYANWSTLLVDAISSDEDRAVLTLKPQQRATEQSIPLTQFDASAYPNAGENVIGTKKWIGYGRTVMRPDLSDTSGNGVYVIADAAYQTLFAINQVQAVDKSTRAKTTLNAGSDYTADLTNCTLTINNAAYAWQSVDIWVDVTGKPDGAGGYLKTGPDIIKDILVALLGVSSAQIDTAAFANAAAQAPQELSVWIKADRQVASIFSGLEPGQPSIGKSVMSNVQQTLAGLWTCFIWKPGADPTTALSLRKEDFVKFEAQPRYGSVYSATRVFYAQDFAAGSFQSTTFSDAKTRYEADTTDTYQVYTFLRFQTDALTLAQRYQLISGALSLEVEFEERGAILSKANAGDKVLVTYNPAPTATGQMSSYPMELIRVDRSLVPVLKMAGRLGDLRGIGAKVGTWQNVGGAGVAWSAATDLQRGTYGFWTDVNGYIVPGDETTRHIRIWW